MDADEKTYADREGGPDIKSIAALRSDTWQRLSPAAVIYYLVKFVSGIVRNGLQAVVPLTAVVATTGDNRWLILMIILSVGGVVMLVGALLSYLNFKFQLEGNSFLIRSGVLTRKRLTLSFDRIQNVALNEPLYFRPLSLVILTLESAGSKSEEVNLAGIPRPLANVIRSHVLEWKSKTQPSTNGTNASSVASNTAKANDATATELLRQPISELAKYGLSNNNLFVLAGVSAALFSQIDEFWESALIAEWYEVVGEAIGTGTIAIAAFIAFAAIAVMLLLVAASVAGAIIANYDYHLSYGGQKYHRKRGLFNREETSVPEKKIQSLRISQPIIARFMSRFHLTLEQIGFASKDGTRKKSSFVIPSVKHGFYQSLAARLYPGTTVLDMPLNPVSNRFVLRHVVYSVGIIASFVSVIWAFQVGWWALVPLSVPILSVPLFMLRRRRYGFAKTSTHGVMRSGFLGQNLTVFAFFKVQTVEIIQSPGQRKHGLADIKIKLAGRTLYMPYMPLYDAVDWRNAMLLEAETNNAPWM